MSAHIPRLIAIAALIVGAHSGLSAQSQSAPVVVRTTVTPPERLRLRGEHGEVVLEGALSPQGAISNLAVVQSSGSAELDAIGQRSYEGGIVDERRRPETDGRIRIEIKVINFGLPDNGPLDYPCEQAVRDYDWWTATFAGRSVREEFLFGALSGMGRVLGVEGLEFVSDRNAYEQAWLKAIAECRNRPQEQFVKLLMTFGNGRPLEAG